MPQVPMLDDDEYLEIEETISTSVRGRAFLRMRDQRASVIASDQVRRLVAKFQGWIETRERSRSEVTGVELLQRDLRELRDHIERSKADMDAELAQIALQQLDLRELRDHIERSKADIAQLVGKETNVS